MDPWPQLVFSAADGQHTVGKFVEELAAQYEGSPPEGLAEQVHELIKTLLHEGILKIHDSPKVLPPCFADDFFAESPERRAEQMRADGLIP